MFILCSRNILRLSLFSKRLKHSSFSNEGKVLRHHQYSNFTPKILNEIELEPIFDLNFTIYVNNEFRYQGMYFHSKLSPTRRSISSPNL